MDGNYEELVGEPEKPLYEVNTQKPIVATDEMREYSRERTSKHIARVLELGERLGFSFDRHDHTKFSEELLEPYILIDNSYRKDLDPPISYTKEMAAASFKHIKAEPHHPEYWDDTVIMNENVDRDSSDVVSTVNAQEMSVPAISEMVCDWCAMSMEVGGHPTDWAMQNIGTRWNFTDEQEELIFLLIRMLWDPTRMVASEYEIDEQPEPKFKVITVKSTEEDIPQGWRIADRDVEDD